jgi:hypothetical protein
MTTQRRRGKRPTTPCLIALYDEGRIAHEAGQPQTENPYEGSGKHGDDIRAAFWRDGWTDGEKEATDIEALI